MKKTLFVSMLTAALMGSAYANTDYTATPGTTQSSPPDFIYGTYTDTGEASGGTVEVFEVETGGYSSLEVVSGGYAFTGSVSGCTASMSGGKVNGDVRGGGMYSGEASGNTVTITGGEVGNDVFGSYVGGDGYVTGNTVTMTGGQVYRYVRCGYTHSGEASGNTVTMTGGQVNSEVSGGVVNSGKATENAVTINDGQVNGYVIGGCVQGVGNATGNTVTMTGGEVGDDVYGGYTNSGDATGNTVNINDGYVDRSVYGGFTKSGKANGNIVNMAGGKGGRYLYGGYVDGDGNATGNTVNMSGGEVERTVMGGVAIGGDATANTVNMTGGTASMVVGGGVGENGNVSGNTVNMAGGSATKVYGGFSETEDGYAKENFVLITGGKADFVYGGVAGGAATGNTVTMTGGEVGDDVYGGYSYFGEASGNTVHLVGEGASYTVGDTTYKGGNIAIQGSVHAGYVEAGGVSSNNSVHIHGTGASIGGTIDSCQRLNFHIVQGQAGALTAPMVTLGGALNLEGVELGFNGDAVTNWAAFNGKSITLVSMTNETITGLLTPTDSVDITDEGGKTVATATLTLSDDLQTMFLTNIQGVAPVPTAGPDALDVTLVNSLWTSSSYVREFVRLAESQGYALKEGDTAVWGGGFGTFMHATGNRGFKSDGGGYGIGVNHAFSANTQAGISFGQGFGTYHNSGANGATVHQRAILAAATASTRIGKDLSIGAHLAFGNVRNRADCHLDGAPTERARWNDNVFNLGARAAYDFHVTERTAITPFLGLDWMNGAHESFGGAYGRYYTHGRLNELRMPVGVTVSTSTEVGSTKLLPQLSVAYVPSLAQQVPHANVSDNGANYRVKGYAPGRNAFMLNVGVNAAFSDSWSAGAFYTLETRSHSVDQSVNASVRYTF